MIPADTEKFYKDKNITGHDYQIMKWIAILSVVGMIILGGIIFRMVGRDQIVAVVDTEGNPQSAKVIDQKIQNVVNYKNFINEFLSTMWTWDQDTFSYRMKHLKNLMTEKCWEDLRLEIKKEGFIDRIRDYEVTSAIIPPPAEKISSAKPYYNEEGERIGWYVDIQAIKINFSNIISKSASEQLGFAFNTNKTVQPFSYRLAFKSTDLSNGNIYGLKVFKYNQKEIKKGDLIQ